MIAGELENAFNAYDLFLFGKKNKDGKDDKPKVSFGEKLQKVGQKIDKAGGIEGIGRTIDNVRSFFKKSDPASAPPADYEFGLKKESQDAQTPPKDNSQQEKEKKKKKLIITAAIVVGGLLITGGLIWWLTSNNKNNQAILTQ